MPQFPSPKNRRKIRHPKQYKPKTLDDKGSNGIHEGREEPHESCTSPTNLNNTTDVKNAPGCSAPREIEPHVITASQEKQVETSPLLKRSPGTQKPKRPGNRSGPKKTRHPNHAVPKKPEDLIKEAIASGQASAQATKRDAQYRKSYAYKIWKEKANCEVRSESTDSSTSKPGIKQAAINQQVSPNQAQSQGRTTYYWPPNQYNSVNNAGFYANGKYYEMNPSVNAQYIHGAPSSHGGPQISQATAPVPQISKTSQPSTTARLTSASTSIKTSTPGITPSGLQGTVNPQTLPQGANHRVKSTSGEYVTEKDASQRYTMKSGAPNVVVMPQYQGKVPERNVSPSVSDSSSSPALKISSSPSSPRSPGNSKGSPDPQAKNTRNSRSGLQPSPTEIDQNDSPAKETAEQRTRSVSTSPSNLVSLMKSSLKRKHSKENVQPLDIASKSKLKTKRKLDPDRDEPSLTKKSTKPTIFSPLNEQEAEKLANDIYDVNLEYFPFQILAEKAAKTGVDTSVTVERTNTENRVQEIEKVR